MYSTSDEPQKKPIDREQLAQQLKLLRYEKGDTVYLRAFFHSDDPRKGDDKGRKAQAQTLDQLIATVQQWQAEGRGVYFVVNGGGHSDPEVKSCRAIFYEHDHLEKEISRDLWQSLGLPEPTFQVDTGGKSIHSYWVLDKSIDPVQWKELQTDLLEYADADKALKNPSRVMRLAGAWHISPNGAYPSKIIASSGVRYSFDLLRSLVPKQKQPASTLPSTPSTLSDDVPLEECLRKEERYQIANGAPDGSRNDAGAALARNLIGTATRLQYLGEQFTGDPRQLFDNYCARCSPPLDAKEADQIWKSAEKDNPTATLTDDALINCIKSWQRRQQALVAKPGNKITELKFPAEVSLRERIEEIISRGLKPSAEKMALLELAKQTSTQPKEIEAIAKLLREDGEIDEGRDERKQEIRELLAVNDNSLDLADFLPKQLADPLKLWCSWLNIPQSVALTAVLTTVSTLHPVGTELVIHRALDFVVPPILFSAVVGESGSKKSPVYRTLIKKPLRVLQNEAIDNYQRQLTQYERDLAEWEKTAGDDLKPTKPGLPIYFFTDATGEGIKTQAQETPHKAMFALIDELAGLFNSANQYRGGKGADRQDMLSYYDGLGQTVLRSAGIKVDVERIYVSVFGGIQPDVLKEHTRDLKDADGQWARFIFVNQPLAASELPDYDAGGIDLKDLLAGCYRRVASLPKREYKLSRAAYKRYQPVYKQLDQMQLNHSQPGMRAVYSKMKGAIGRFALNLHALQSVVDGVDGTVDGEISLEAMNKAIALADFYIGQIKMLHADSRADKGELSALLAKVLKLAQTKGKLSATAANQGLNAIKSNSQALDCFRELESMGYGKVAKEKASWIFYPTTVDGVDGSVDGSVDGQNYNKTNTLSLIVDGVDGVDDLVEKQNHLASLGSADPEATTTPVPPDEEKKPESIYGIYDTYDKPENLTAKGKSTVDATVDAPSTPSTVDGLDALKPLGFSLQPGDRVRCYPTDRHSENKWEVNAVVVEVQGENGWFVQAIVEYTDRKANQRRRVTISGGRVNWILRKL